MKTENQTKFTFNLFDRLCTTEFLLEGFKAVKKNRGSAGIDGVSILEFEGRLDEEIQKLKSDLENWKYKPSPVKQVKIPKPGKNSGVRLLGIPTVRDRIVQSTVKLILEPILDPTFSVASYGFRPGRNQRQAIESAQAIVRTGKEYVVDIDLAKFFDTVNQDKLIHRLSLYIEDKRILKLVGQTLRSGILEEGIVLPSSIGTVQGSPLSPLLSNLVLDELDKELERRGLEFCRYADDCNIFVGSKKAAHRVMKSISHYIEKKLKLKVNREKSKVAISSYVTFLGMTIFGGIILISNVAMNRAMKKTNELIPRGTNITLEDSMQRVNRWYRGWANYFKMTEIPAQLRKIEAHIRRRFRARIVVQQKNKRNLFNKLIKRGVSKKLAGTVFSNKKTWFLSHTRAVERAYPNKWFIKEMKQKIVSDKFEEHWFGEDIWMKAP